MLLRSLQTIDIFLLFFYFLNYQRALILSPPFQKKRETHTKSFFGTAALFLLQLEVLCKGGQAYSASSESCSTTGIWWKVTKSCHGAELNVLTVSRGAPHQKGGVQPWNYIFWNLVRFPVSRQYGVSLKKLKIELLYDPTIPLLGKYLEEWISWKDTCTPVFLAALFTTGQIWKKPKCPLIDESSAIERMKYCICSKTDGSREYHTKWSEPGRKRQILHITYMQNLVNNINESIYTTDSQALKTNLWLPREREQRRDN